MKLRIRRSVVALFLLTGVAVFAMQQTGTGTGSGRGGRRGASTEEEDVVLPNGHFQKDEILKADHQQNLKDAAELVELSQLLKTV